MHRSRPTARFFAFTKERKPCKITDTTLSSRWSVSMRMSGHAGSGLALYLPRLLIEWQDEAPDTSFREIEGTLVFVDISGFTRMSERLARQGKVGAEEVTDVLNSTFSRLLTGAWEDGG